MSLAGMQCDVAAAVQTHRPDQGDTLYRAQRGGGPMFHLCCARRCDTDGFHVHAEARPGAHRTNRRD
jgi:hypothetical protein